MIDFKKIKLIISDCDGVLTDGKVFYGGLKEEMKTFSAKDGLAAVLAQKASNLKIAIVTGRESAALKMRCDDLGISLLYQNIKNKQKKVSEILEENNLTWENVAYIGDDLNDYLVMQKVAFAFCPNDSAEDIKFISSYILERKGGEGCLREAVDFILKKQNKYEEAKNNFVALLNSQSFFSFLCKRQSPK